MSSMTEKKVNTISAVLQIVFLVLSFAPMILEEQYMTASYSPGAYAIKSRFASNMYAGYTKIIPILVAVVCLISIVLFILKITGKETGKLVEYSKYLPAGVAVLYVIFGIYENQVIYANGELMFDYPLYADYCFGFDLMVGFWIELLIIAGAALISLPIITDKYIMHSTAQGPEQKTEKEGKKDMQVQPAAGFSDLLIEYKKLLDDGILTQEEFDEMKNDLLGQ